jgi:two-component system response regulator AtoC
MQQPARIAIVDDDALFVDYLSVFLRSRGYETSVFQSGTALLAALNSRSAPDVVLLDVLMPNMNGLETLRAIRAASPNLQVIMLSGQQVPATIVDAVRLGAIDYVVKSDESSAIHEAALEAAICRALERSSLTNEVARLTAHVAESPEGTQVCWGTGPAMREVLTMVDRIADSDVSVLLTGESGTGKEVIARELHRRSPRRARPFVKVNCAALPSELLESELFGHERGAFTGAQNARIGKFEFANLGTLVLDEIGEMPLGLQAKLLHVLQDRAFTKLGSNRPIEVDVRVVASTNRDLASMIRAGQFREDLFYRLQVIEIRVPALRDRRDEIPALIDFFGRQYSSRYGRPQMKPSPALMQALLTYSWPGNVRELENMIKRFVILRDEAALLADLGRSRALDGASEAAASHEAPAGMGRSVPALPAREDGLDAPAQSPAARDAKLPDLARAAALSAERAAIQDALDRFRWNRRKAASHLGVSYKTLLNKMKECRIVAPTHVDVDD